MAFSWFLDASKNWPVSPRRWDTQGPLNYAPQEYVAHKPVLPRYNQDTHPLAKQIRFGKNHFFMTLGNFSPHISVMRVANLVTLFGG